MTETNPVGGKPATPTANSANWIVHSALIAASILAALPLFLSQENSRSAGWEQTTNRYQIVRTALLRDRQWPLWNPHRDNGTPLLADPESPAASPAMLFVLLLGTDFGLRVLMTVLIAAGATGTASLLARGGVAASIRCLGGLLFIASLRWVVDPHSGRFEWCTLALLPWITLCLLRMQTDFRWGVAAALILAAVLASGSAEVSAAFILLFSGWTILDSLRTGSPRPALCWCTVFAVALLLSAPKHWPAAEYYAAHPGHPESHGAVIVQEAVRGDEFHAADRSTDPWGPFLQSGSQQMSLTDSSLAEATISLQTETEDRLFFAQKGAVGWRAVVRGRNGGRYENAAGHPSGLVSVPIHPGDEEVTIQYIPDSFVWGVCVFVLTLLASAAFLISATMRRRSVLNASVQESKDRTGTKKAAHTASVTPQISTDQYRKAG